MNLTEITALKFQYPNHELILAEICNRKYIFRNISKKEFIDAQAMAVNNYEFNEIICEMAVVFPEDSSFSNGLAGIPDTIAPIIIKHSDFEGNSLINRYYIEKQGMETFEEQAMAMIKAAMPEYVYDTMEHWPLSKLIKEATRAEYILKDIKGLNIEWKLNDEEIEESEEQEQKHFREICHELIERGVDPIMQLWPMINPGEKELDRPLIGGYHWRNEEIMNAIRNQISRYKGQY